MTSGTLLRFIRPHRGRLALAAVLMSAESGVTLILPWLAGQFAAGVLVDTATDLGLLMVVLIGMFGARAFLKFFRNVLLSRIAQRVLANLRVLLYDHLQALPLSFFHQRQQGEVLALLTQDVRSLSRFITFTIPSLLPLVLTLIGALAIMISMAPFLAIGVGVLIPAFYAVIRVIGRRIRPVATELREAQAAQVSVLEENLGMLPVIKTFTREPYESERHAQSVERIERLSATQARMQAALGPTAQFLAASAAVLLLWLATDQVRSGAMSTAELVSFVLYAALLTQPVSGMASLWGDLQFALGTLERLDRVLVESAEPLVSGQELGEVRGEVEFAGVSFSYPGRAATVADIDLTIRAGEKIALTGENGAGKSTLVSLLVRLYRPDAGRIRIDGIDIAGVSLESLRGQIGVVPQNVLLFSGTVADNIAYGRLGATDQEIREAAGRAQAHAFIRALPEGYDTMIGDRGVRLSGGQRQRIALARAILKDPAILVLDEPTAMFDPAGERAFVADAHRAFEGKTVLLITHRPESLALVGRIIELRAGRIASDCRAEGARATTAT